jgi:hypothetical protein
MLSHDESAAPIYLQRAFERLAFDSALPKENRFFTRCHRFDGRHAIAASRRFRLTDARDV